MRSESINKAELSKLPYLRRVPNDGRVAPVLAFWDSGTGEWHLYMVVAPGELGRVATAGMVTGSYIASVPAEPSTDTEFVLGTFVLQHLSFANVLRPIEKIQSDIHHCAAILEKYDLIWRTQGNRARSASLLIQSEIEYLVLLLRSLYDLLQEVVKAVAAKLIVLDGTSRPVLKQLPKSFGDIALSGDNVRSADDIEKHWNVPRPLADWYAEEAGFFRLLRGMRDSIAHSGNTPPTVFETEWGFAIAPDTFPWREVHALLPGERRKNDLASLRGLFASAVLTAIGSTERFAGAIRRFVELPEPILGDVKVFVRSPFGERLTSLESVIGQPWEGRDLQSGTATEQDSSGV